MKYRIPALALVLSLAACGEGPTDPQLPFQPDAQLSHTAGPTASSLIETFDDATLDELEDADGAFTVAGGVITKTFYAPFLPGGNSDRSYVRTLATGYNAADFTAELTFTLTDVGGPGDGQFAIHFIGLGSGEPDGVDNEASGVLFRIHGSDVAGGRVDAAVRAPGSGFSHLQTFGHITSSGGTHRARITKTGSQVVLSIDKDYNGTFVADMTSDPIDLTTDAPFLDSSNSRIYFGTASNFDWFDDLVISVGSDNAPPTANAGPDASYECEGDATSVTLDGSASSDPDGDALTYTWSMGGSDIATGATATVSLPLGTHTVTLTVDDGNGASASDDVVITVEDTTAPTITASFEPVTGGDDDDNLFSVSFSCSDGCDTGPTSVADINGVSVANGQVVKLKVKDNEKTWKVKWDDDGVLKITAGSIVLTVSCTDASGNTTTVTVDAPQKQKSEKSKKKSEKSKKKSEKSKKKNGG